MRLRAVVFVLLLITICSNADTPPSNTIPVIGLKPGYEDINTEFFCFLSWNYFDGLSRQGYEAQDILENVVLPADTTGMLSVINPWVLTSMTTWFSHMFAMNTDSAYAWPVWNGYTFDGVTYTEDGLLGKKTPAVCRATMEGIAEELDLLFNQNSHSVWFYYSYDEAPAFQYSRMVRDSAGHVFSEYDDFMPSLFTQQMDSVYRPDLDFASDSAWQPTLAEVDPRGVLSWMNYHIVQADSTRELGYVISTMHTLKDWAGATNINEGYNFTPPNFDNQAQTVRSLFAMQYQGYITGGIQPDLENNYPSFIAHDAYPFRLVGTAYQDSLSYTQVLGDSLENWMLDHYEEGMDSTFITAWNIRINGNDHNDISMFFVPQSFGKSGGTGMWDTIPGNPPTYFLNYGSYGHRIPTPQEFRMTCNSGLIRQAKAIFPYCLVSYSVGDVDESATDVGLLDENNIPFDAPYEDWVYRNRPTDSLLYISPDSIAPFIDDYDPLYDLPSRPVPVSGSERNTENFLLWKFAAYGRLWNSVKPTLAQIARTAPELAPLQWWEFNENNANIEYDAQFLPLMFRSPQIKVFTDSLENNCYLFYLNRFCRGNNSPFEIVVDAMDFPVNTPFSEYALDHSRRFIIEGDMYAREIYTFLDTLDAGEARLIQMFDKTDGLPVDVRITDPDLSVILPTKGDTLLQYRSTPGTPVDVIARFYNMGTEPKSNIRVCLYDVTDDEILDRTRISFHGLSTNTCYTVDRAVASLHWTPEANDIGVHILEVYAESWIGEPDPEDNSATLIYIVNPKDYATSVLDNPWDMTEVRPPAVPPLWHTNDVSAIGGGWKSTSFTDSVSGMFEGVLDPAISGNIFRGDISLAIPEDSTINTDQFYNLSFGAVCMNPNSNATTAAGSVLHLWWIDSKGYTHTANLSNESEIGAIRNGTDQWRTYGPLDLGTVNGLGWNAEEASEFWLSFRTGKPAAPEVPQPVDIRIGWVKLTD